MSGSKPRAHSLSYYQLRGSLLGLFIAVTAIGGMIYHYSEQALLENVKNNLQYHADFRKERILSLFQKQMEWLEEVSYRTLLSSDTETLLHSYQQEGAEGEAYLQISHQLRKQYRPLLNTQGVEDLFLITTEGELAFSLRPMEEEIGVDLTRDGFYGETILSKLIDSTLTAHRPVISRYGKVEQVEESTVLMGTPLFSTEIGHEEKIIGILVRPFSLKRLRDLLNSYSGLGETGEVIIAQWRGEGMGSGVNFINHFRYGDQASPDSTCIQLRSNQPELFSVLHALSETNGADWMIDNACKPVFGVWTWIQELEWGMVVKQDRSEIITPVVQMRYNILPAAIAILLLLVWMVRKQSNLLVRPIERLTHASEQGEVINFPPTAIHEVNQLALTLQQMLMMLQENEQLLEQKVVSRTAELNQQRSEMASILTSMEEGLLVTDQQGTIIRANQKIAALYQAGTPDTLIGKPITELFASTTLLQQMLRSASADDEAPAHLTQEHQLLACNGLEVPVQCSAAVLKSVDQHQINGAVIILYDLRERLQQEQERNEQANQLAYQEGLAEMSANVLHNIGNAVAGLNGRVEMNHAAIKHLQQIQQQLEQAASINDLSQLQQGLGQLAEILSDILQQQLQPSSQALMEGVLHISDIITVQQQMAFGHRCINTRFSLQETIQRVMGLHQESNKKLHIETLLTIDPALDEVNLPQNQFMQMLDNLIKNSREAIAEQQQATPSTAHLIRITLLPEQTNFFQLLVEDSGIGIPKASLQTIFQRNITTKQRGSGIGLHATSTFVRSLKGRIEASSPGSGEGARFTITLPLDGAHSNATEKSSQHETA